MCNSTCAPSEYFASRSAVLIGADHAASHAYSSEYNRIDATAAAKLTKCNSFAVAILSIHDLHSHYCTRYYYRARYIVVASSIVSQLQMYKYSPLNDCIIILAK